jgi:hypothetical protein
VPYPGGVKAGGSGDGVPAYAPYGYPTSVPPATGSTYAHPQPYPGYNYAGYHAPGSASAWGYASAYGSYAAAGYGTY